MYMALPIDQFEEHLTTLRKILVTQTLEKRKSKKHLGETCRLQREEMFQKVYMEIDV